MIHHHQNKKAESGEIWVNKFTEDSAYEFRENVLKIATKDANAPIIIYIDSYGGQVDALAKMVDTMQQFGNPFITVCLGKAMSCGAILLSCGDYRYCAPNSRVMVHEVSSGTSGDVHDNVNNAKESLRLNIHFLGLLADNCGLKGGFKALRKMIKDHDGRELWLDATQALKFGIIDEVGLPQVKASITYQLVTTNPMSRKDRLKRSSSILGLE